VVALYTALGFVLAPWLVRRHMTKYVTEQLVRQVSIGEVRVNPLLFTFEAKDFALEEVDGLSICGFGRLFVDFQLSSLVRWAWTFAEIRLEQPSLHVDVRPDGRLNLAVLADSLPESEESPEVDRPPPRLLLQHAAVVDGSFTFSDRSGLTPASATFTPLDLELNDISTLPERKGPYVVRAALPDGGTVGWRGEVSLRPVFSEGELSVNGLKLATVWQFRQDRVRLTEPAGEVDFSTRYRFAYQDRKTHLVAEGAKLAVKGLALTKPDASASILALEAIDVTDGRFDLQAREFAVPNLSVRNGRLAASVGADGLLDWQKLVVQRQKPDTKVPAPVSSAPALEPWRLELGAVKVENVALDYTDHSRVIPLAVAVGGLEAGLHASAEVGAGPVQAAVDGLGVNLDRVELSEPGGDTVLLALDTLALEDGSMDLAGRALSVTRVAARGGRTTVARSEDGSIRLLEMLGPTDSGEGKQKVVETGVEAGAEGEPWSFRVDALELNDFRLALLDRTVAPAIAYELHDIRIAVKDLTNDGRTPITFDAGFEVAEGGSATVSAQVGQAADHADARVDVKGLNLEPLQPLVAESAALTLESGHVSASVRASYRSLTSRAQLRTNGSVRVTGLRLNEAETGDRFLGWEAMSADGLEFGLSPDRLHIKEVRLLEPSAKIVIFEDRSVNLTRVMKPADASGAETATVERDLPFSVSIDQVRIDNGAVDFADLSLVLPFAAEVTEFNGAVRGISSDPASRSSLEFEGRVDEYGFTKMDGSVSLFAPRTFTDISVVFRNVKMTPLSPYSATFAGRKIASGTLNLDLEYKMQNSELVGDNKVVLEKFTLGERVEAPNARSLSLDLAIALLTDTEGKIDVAVPVHGNVDNPQFSYGHVIRQAIFNLVTRIVTSPFRVLGRLLGGKGEVEQLDTVAFDPGSAWLLPPEREKLKRVGEVLGRRPRLKLVVQGRFDPEADGRALRTERVQRALAKQLDLKVAPDEDPGPVAFDSAKTQRGLEALLNERGGADAIDGFEAQYEKTTGTEVKRVNPLLALIGRASPDTAFYRAMFERLVELEPLSNADLQVLARLRTEAIVEELTTAGGLHAGRVTSGSVGPVEEVAAKTVNSKLSLDVIKPAS
jgi:hypothetical protein